MGFFRKKADPLAQRAQSLNRRIAELEAEIARLSRTAAGNPRRPPATEASPPSSPEHKPGSAAPRPEPAFERIPNRPHDPRPPAPPAEEAAHLGLKRAFWWQRWRRWKGNFVDAPPANAKLVNYLAVGGIQGLRPLRYEKRIARNRILFVCVVLGLMLWGVLVMFWHTR